jgi:hypothetical protein
MGLKQHRLELDFRRERPAAPWAGRLLLAISVAFAGDVGISYVKEKSRIATSEAVLAKNDVRIPRSAKVVSKEEMALARETVERLAMPWDNLFSALESAASDKVALLGIEPDPKAGTVTISGDSKDYLAALTYVLNLSRSEVLSKVQLVRHEVKASEPQKPVAFSVSASWFGGKK